MTHSMIGTPIPTYTPGQNDPEVFRAHADPSVWMCNIPEMVVADGVQAASSLKRIKQYVEETLGVAGRWERLENGAWRFSPEE